MIGAILLASWVAITADRPIDSKDIERPFNFLPPTTRDTSLFMSFLDHPDRRIRSKSAWAAGDSEWHQLGPRLAERLSRESNAWVRADIVHAMGRLKGNGETNDDGAERKDPGAIWKLLQLSDPDPEVRRWAVWSIGEWKAVAAVAAVADRAHRDESEPVRMMACRTLGRLGGAQAETALAEATRDKSARVREAAATAIGALPEHGETGLKAILAALEDKDSLVRAAAVGALGLVDEFPVEGPVAEMASDDFALVRKEVAISLRRIGALEKVQTTIQLLNDRDMSVRTAAAQALGTFGSTLAIPPLVMHLNDADKFVRRSSATALRDLQMADEIVPVLITQLKHKSPEPRREAGWVLGEYRDKRATLALMKNVPDDDEEASLNTIEALGKVQDTLAVPTLIEVLANGMAAKRAMAAWSLGQIGDKRATEPLVPILFDRDHPPRLQAATAAGRINDAPFVAPLIKVLQNVTTEQFSTRAAASWSLGQIGDARAVARLQQMVSDKVIPTPFGPVYDHDSVRMNSAIALMRIARNPRNAGQLQAVTAFLDKQFDQSLEMSDLLKECLGECLYLLTGKEYPFERRPPGHKQYFVRSVEVKD